MPDLHHLLDELTPMVDEALREGFEFDVGDGSLFLRELSSRQGRRRKPSAARSRGPANRSPDPSPERSRATPPTPRATRSRDKVAVLVREKSVPLRFARPEEPPPSPPAAPRRSAPARSPAPPESSAPTPAPPRRSAPTPSPAPPQSSAPLPLPEPPVSPSGEPVTPARIEAVLRIASGAADLEILGRWFSIAPEDLLPLLRALVSRGKLESTAEGQFRLPEERPDGAPAG